MLRLCGTVDGIEQIFHLDAGRNTVGRAPDNSIVLAAPGISRWHAVLHHDPEGLTVEDLGSRNGTFVDGRRVERARVEPGGKLGFGALGLRVERALTAEAELAIELEALDRKLRRSEETTLENHDSGGLFRECWKGLVFPTGYCPGSSEAVRALYRQLRAALRSQRPVLIVGETGVGKELVAATLHLSSERRHGPRVALNCAAIPAELLEAEMFGIGKGVATGVAGRQGRFELAEGGILFLDEIGEMAPELQAKLLRVLQEGEIQPVGGRPRPVDVRVVAATNADLHERMEEGTFRPDLYYRLAGHRIEVPPLRACREDVPELVAHFLRAAVRETGVAVRGLTTSALRLLVAYPWPGNVRELEHEIHRLVCTAAAGTVLDDGMLPDHIRHPPFDPTVDSDPTHVDTNPLALEPKILEVEETMIREALRRAGGKKIRAAELLGISRNGLAKKMKRLGIDREASPP
jgi:transcriptional regulator with GAF, ATPase, and Fis domain